MTFAPYHTFSEAARLEILVQRFHANGDVRKSVYESHNCYHYALLHKLRSARQYLEDLDRFVESESTLDLSAPEVIHKANFYFDGFLHSVGSSLDIFAREILGYFAIRPRGNVYYHSAHGILRRHRSRHRILPCITVPKWRAEFSIYRNASTHELVIGTEYRLDIKLDGDRERRSMAIPLPDDPRSLARTYKRNLRIEVYCRKIFKKVLSHYNKAYRIIVEESKKHGTLPM